MYDQMYIEAHLADLRREFEAQKLVRTWRTLIARDRAFTSKMAARSPMAAHSHQPVRAED